MRASKASRACSQQAPTSAGSRRVATRAASPRRSSSAASRRNQPSGNRLEIGAAPQVAWQRRGRDLRHAQSVVVLLDLLADRGHLAVALAQLIAVRRPDEPEVRACRWLTVLHGAKA